MGVLSCWYLRGKWGSWGSAELSDPLGKLFLSRAMYLGCTTDVLMSVAVFMGGWWIGREPKPPLHCLCASQATVLKITAKCSVILRNDTRTVYFSSILNLVEGGFGWVFFCWVGGVWWFWCSCWFLFSVSRTFFCRLENFLLLLEKTRHKWL